MLDVMGFIVHQNDQSEQKNVIFFFLLFHKIIDLSDFRM